MIINYDNSENISTGIYIKNIDTIDQYKLYNPYFGKQALINYLEYLKSNSKLNLLYCSSNRRNNNIDSYAYLSPNLTIDILEKYIDPSKIYNTKFWAFYSESININLEQLLKYIHLKWNWCVLVQYNPNINLKFIDDNYDKISFNNDKYRYNTKIILYFFLLLNNNVSWKDKQTILVNIDFSLIQIHYDLLGDRVESCFMYKRINTSKEISRTIDFPYHIIKDLIYKGENSFYYYHFYNLNYYQLLKNEHLPEDLISYVLKNKLNVNNSRLLDDINYKNITPNLVIQYNLLNFNEYAPFCWYQYQQYPELLKKLNEQANSYWINDDKYEIGKSKYLEDRYRVYMAVYRIQLYWNRCRFNPDYKICKNIQKRRLNKN